MEKGKRKETQDEKKLRKGNKPAGHDQREAGRKFSRHVLRTRTSSPRSCGNRFSLTGNARGKQRRERAFGHCDGLNHAIRRHVRQGGRVPSCCHHCSTIRSASMLENRIHELDRFKIGC